MTAPESIEPINPAAIMVAHADNGCGWCLARPCDEVDALWPCETYRLAAEVQRLQGVERDVRHWVRAMQQMDRDDTVSATCRSAGDAVLDMLDNPYRSALAVPNQLTTEGREP